MNTQKYDNLYQRYGYTLNKALSNTTIRVYTLKKGVYFGADIVSLNDNEDYNNIVKQLSGYACRFKCYKNIEEAENFLFESFFHSTQLKERLKNRYKSFKQSQSEILKVDYEYIPVSYVLENEVKTQNIIDSVTNKLQEKGAQLIIIEAAAGYGKTCTSFEIINKISLSIRSLVPIFTELSRDRRAAIFKHILQDIIITEFHSLLNEELVIHEIKNGKIPLIIDGFDELLSKEQDRANSEFEEVETMLSTIGDLLENNAKIIITGRKTAIFSGDSFAQWIDSNPNKFIVSRYLLNPPRLRDWLDEDKINKIKQKNIPISEISNPVLLAFLRSLDLNSFETIIKNPQEIVFKYFNAILDREQERQQLNIEPEKQLHIFRKLTKSMMEFDITSDSKSWIKDLILDKNYELLDEARKSYAISKRPSMDELCNTLSNHALLDRKGNKENIGFINDFIFGTFIGENIIQEDMNLNEDLSKHMIELATTAFQFQSKKNKNLLHDKVSVVSFLSNQDKFVTEFLLKGEVLQKFKNTSFNDFSISKIQLNSYNQFSRCVFANCTFDNVAFHNRAFFETSFVNCIFNECTYSTDNNTPSVYFMNCKEYGKGFIDTLSSEGLNDDSNDDNISLTEVILGKFFDTGGRPRHKKISTIINEVETNKKNDVSKIINKLKVNEWIKMNGDNAFLTDLGIQQKKK